MKMIIHTQAQSQSLCISSYNPKSEQQLHIRSQVYLLGKFRSPSLLAAMSFRNARRRRSLKNSNPISNKNIRSCSSAATTTGSSLITPEPDNDNDRKTPELKALFRRFWKVAAPYWFSDDKVQARLQLAAVFALTLATTGISVGFNFLGRDFYNALASESVTIGYLFSPSLFLNINNKRTYV